MIFVNDIGNCQTYPPSRGLIESPVASTFMNVECLPNVPQARGLRSEFWASMPPYLWFEPSEKQQEVSLRRLCCLSFYNLERSFRSRQIAGGIAAGLYVSLNIPPEAPGPLYLSTAILCECSVPSET
ncbi:hypothetical protein AB1N83_007500 [Pleurotus pulmonarius]